MTTKNSELSKRCQKAAIKFLDARGYEIVEEGFETSRGEIPLVCMDGDTLVFVSVRCKRKIFGDDRMLRPKWEEMAAEYLSQGDFTEGAFRFDIVSVLPINEDRAMIRHIISALSVA